MLAIITPFSMAVSLRLFSPPFALYFRHASIFRVFIDSHFIRCHYVIARYAAFDFIMLRYYFIIATIFCCRFRFAAMRFSFTLFRHYAAIISPCYAISDAIIFAAIDIAAIDYCCHALFALSLFVDTLFSSLFDAFIRYVTPRPAFRYAMLPLLRRYFFFFHFIICFRLFAFRRH